MVGLEGFRPDMTDYHQCIKLIEDHVKQFSAKELEEMNAKAKQAGVTCLKWEEFEATSHVIAHEKLCAYSRCGLMLH